MFLLWIIGFPVTICSVDNSVYPAAEQYGLGNLIPFLNYVDIQNYIKRLRRHVQLALGSYETLHFYAVGEYGPVTIARLPYLIIHKLERGLSGFTTVSR